MVMIVGLANVRVTHTLMSKVIVTVAAIVNSACVAQVKVSMHVMVVVVVSVEVAVVQGPGAVLEVAVGLNQENARPLKSYTP